MKKKRESGNSDVPLRRRAEQRLAEQNEKGAHGPPPDPTRLAHELQVYQVELEVQNEELRAARAELEEGLTRYTELFDFAPIGYVSLSRDRRIREVNLACAHMLGEVRQALVGKSLRLYVGVVSLAAYDKLIDRALSTTDKTRASETIEIWLAGNKVDPIQARLSATAIHWGALIAIENVTAQKRAEAALVEESQRKDQFLATLSHELRNPLAPIRNSIVVLKRRAEGGKQVARAVAILDRQTKHLSRIVDDLLDTTRIAHGKIELQPESVDLGMLARQAVEDHLSDFQTKGIELSYSIGPGRLFAEVDPTRLAQVLGNLLVNAWKFTPKGGRVEVCLHREGAQTVLSVRDTGAGIEPGVRERLFEPFFQATQGLDRRAGGLGLGLLMAKSLVELHGGTIDVSSGGLGKGSVFTIRLPIIDVVEQPPDSEEVSIRPRRVLVIEDNVDGADALRDVLEISGHEVQVAHSGLRGIELALEHKPEIVFCDIGLPGMDGYEVARAMREDPALAGIYLVALSGYTRREDRSRALKAGFNKHLAKPPTLQQLDKILAAG